MNNRYYIFFLFIVMLASCSKDNKSDCLKSIGKVVIETRAVGSFSDILLEDNINLYLKQDTLYAMRIEAGENLQAFISTEIEGQQLHIKNENKCNWTRSYKSAINIYLSVPNLKTIMYKGSGNIISENTLNLSSLEVGSVGGSGIINLSLNNTITYLKNFSGPATFIVSGRSSSTYVYLCGYGKITCNDLITEFTFCTHKGTNNCFINTTIYMQATLTNVGNIYYSGTPDSSNIEIKGSGRIIPL